jgi:hypothetical protein
MLTHIISVSLPTKFMRHVADLPPRDMQETLDLEPLIWSQLQLIPLLLSIDLNLLQEDTPEEVLH